jgi:hypothetical protein
MSFLDQSDDPEARGPRRSADGGAADHRTLLIRRSVALVVGVLLLIALVLGIRGCLSARAEQQLTDYTRDTSDLVQESNRQSEQFFGLLRNPAGRSPADLQATVNGVRVRAARLVDRAGTVESPDEISEAHEFLTQTLEFRRDGLTAVARRLPAALADEGRGAASAQIAAQMQNFVASDVIYSQRFLPGLQGRLRSEQLLGQVRPPRSVFTQHIDWLEPRFVSARLDAIREGEDADGGAAPGLHGTGLGTVTVQPGGQTLAEQGGAAIPVTEDLAFAVQVQNQGQSVEQDVSVEVAITGAGRPIRVRATLDTIAVGATETVTIPLATAPPTGQPVSIVVRIAPVRGERMLDNNRGTFRAVFDR